VVLDGELVIAQLQVVLEVTARVALACTVEDCFGITVEEQPTEGLSLTADAALYCL
jgi:hypothetical protein